MERTLRGRHRARLTLAFAGSLALPAFLAGCSSDATRPRTTQGAEIGWITPAANDTLRGNAEFLAWVDLGEPVLGVTFFVNGQEVAARDVVPWSCTWRPSDVTSGPELRRLILEVEAQGERSAARHPPMEVWYERDDPPTLRLSLPGETDWVEIGPDRFLGAIAEDREQGGLDPAGVEWRTDEGRRFRGAEFPTELLTPGDRQIRAWVTDRAGNRTDAEINVRAFRFEGGEHALGAARDLQAALSALDLEALSAILAPEFQMEECERLGSGHRPDPLSRSEILALLREAAESPDLSRLLFGGEIQLESGETRGWALARWRHLGVLVGRGEEEWRTIGLSAELILRQRPDEAWRVVAWRELDRGDGPGVPALLRSGLPYP